MKTRALIVIAAASFCMGCANISTIGRTTTLPPFQGGFITGPGAPNQGTSGREGSGLAIHLDAPQRVILSKSGIICAEPSPDALQAYASSQSFGLSIPSKADAAFANALATGAGSIGLRTQSITLMRDHLYRICEASYNDKLTKPDVAQLFRRSQDMTLGILAIEQLTGAVVARQVMLNSNANADASANVANTKAQLDRVREEERLAEDAFAKATTKREEQQNLVDQQKEKLKDPANATSEEQAHLVRLEEQLENDKQAAQDANVSYEDAKETTKLVKANFGAAKVAASAAAKVKGEFSEKGYITNKLDSSTVTALSLATQNIVTNILGKGHVTDSCITILNLYATDSKHNEEAYKKLNKQCEAVIEAAIKEFHAQSEYWRKKGDEKPLNQKETGTVTTLQRQFRDMDILRKPPELQ